MQGGEWGGGEWTLTPPANTRHTAPADFSAASAPNYKRGEKTADRIGATGHGNSSDEGCSLLLHHSWTTAAPKELMSHCPQCPTVLKTSSDILEGFFFLLLF